MGANIVGSSGQGSDDAVIGGVDVGVSRFGYTDMDLSGCIRTSR